MEKKYVCPCGLTCCDCLFYKKEFFESAHAMKKLIEEYRFDYFYNLLSRKKINGKMAEHLKQEKFEYIEKFSIFETMPDFVKTLDGIISIQCKNTCRENNGCSIGGVTHACDVLTCVNEKYIEGCWECTEHQTCKKLSFQKSNYGKTISENIELLKNQGTDSLQARGNQYYEWQRKIIKKDQE